MLRLDDGIRTWIQCRYERVHKLYPGTAPLSPTSNTNPNPTRQIPIQTNTMHSNLNFVVHSLHLDNHDDPITPFNTPIPSPEQSLTNGPRGSDYASNMFPLQHDHNSHTHTNSSGMHTDFMPLRWTWLDGVGPFVTNGNFRDNHHSSSEIDSDSLTVTMFNLNHLNMDRPEVRGVSLWERGQIPESPVSLVEDLVRRVNRDYFNFELGGASDGPHLTRGQAQCYEVNITRDNS
ncbi:hypothetical protein SO802_002387 [Lithocarpus litseifolius]|uniref:Uncharacterized protein n=1 Tax=Lithocarpus litseifolius TaxID=425828 RepID=A0AAW2DXE4_9ROSI